MSTNVSSISPDSVASRAATGAIASAAAAATTGAAGPAAERTGSAASSVSPGASTLATLRVPWGAGELVPGLEVVARFAPNPLRAESWPLRADSLDERPTGKIVLCRQGGLPVGEPVRVRVVKVTHPERSDRGRVEVEALEQEPFGEGVWVPDDIGRQLPALLEGDCNILFIGPQGCGKTTIVRRVARACAFRYVYFNCAGVMDPDDFLAVLHLEAEGGATRTAWRPTPLLNALRDAASRPSARVLVCLDELNRCPEHARNVLMPALDTTRVLHDPTTNRPLRVPENVTFVAAVNVGQAFSGTFGIDAAQLDRFVPLQLSWPPPEAEERIVRRAYPEADPALVHRVVAIAHALRNEPGLEASLSVRATEQALRLLTHRAYASLPVDEALAEVLRTTFCNRLGGAADVAESEAGRAWQLIRRLVRRGA